MILKYSHPIRRGHLGLVRPRRPSHHHQNRRVIQHHRNSHLRHQSYQRFSTLGSIPEKVILGQLTKMNAHLGNFERLIQADCFNSNLRDLSKLCKCVSGVRTNLENSSKQFSFSNRDEIVVFDNKISFSSVKTLCIHSIASCIHCCHFSSNTYCKLHPSIFEFWYEVPTLSNLRTILKRNV